MVCITAAKYNMFATVLRPSSVDENGDVTPDGAIDEPNEWILTQDPDTGEIIRSYSPVVDNPSTPDVNEAETLGTISLMARGIISDGIQAAGTTERYGEVYENLDYVRIWFPATVALSKRDQIKDIRDRDGNTIWAEEETPGSPPTVFNVLGVTPMPNPFGRVVEKTALLERSERQ